jgi:hypothetical protein
MDSGLTVDAEEMLNPIKVTTDVREQSWMEKTGSFVGENYFVRFHRKTAHVVFKKPLDINFP